MDNEEVNLENVNELVRPDVFDKNILHGLAKNFVFNKDIYHRDNRKNLNRLFTFYMKTLFHAGIINKYEIICDGLNNSDEVKNENSIVAELWYSLDDCFEEHCTWYGTEVVKKENNEIIITQL